MPTYLLTTYDDEGDVVETPFLAGNDLLAERDMLALAAGMGPHLVRFTVARIALGGYDAGRGEIATRRLALVHDSAAAGPDPDPDPDDAGCLAWPPDPRHAPIPTAAEDVANYPFP